MTFVYPYFLTLVFVVSVVLLPPPLLFGQSPLVVAPQVSFPLTLTLNSPVKIDTERIYLGDLATCIPAMVQDPVCDELSGIDLGKSPAPGKSLLLHHRKILKWLRVEWPHRRVRLTGADPIKVEADVAVFDAEKIRRLLQVDLRNHYREKSDLRFRVEKVQLSRSISVRPGYRNFSFPVLRSPGSKNLDWIVKNLLGPQNLEVRVAPESSVSKDVSVFFNAQIAIDWRLPVATRNLLRQEVIGRRDVAPAWVPMTRNAAKFVKKSKDLVGKRLRRTIGVGSAVQVKYVVKPLLIERGQVVKMRIRAKDIRVDGRVKALSGGGYGDLIDVEYPGTKKKFRAKIKSASLVEYTF